MTCDTEVKLFLSELFLEHWAKKETTFEQDSRQ